MALRGPSDMAVITHTRRATEIEIAAKSIRFERERCERIVDQRSNLYLDAHKRHDGTPQGASFYDKMGACESILHKIRHGDEE